MRLTRVQAAVAAGVMALATSAGAVLAGPGAASAAQLPARTAAPAKAVPATAVPATAVPAKATTQTAGYLYYDTGQYISRVPVAGGTPRRVVRVGNGSVTGMAISDGRLFWVTEDSSHDPISYVPLSSVRPGVTPQARQLVGGLSFPLALVSADGWLYWVDENAIGRVRPNGKQLTRRFISMPQENGGGVADGLATDGSHLYFSRCQNDEIGRVSVSGAALNMSFIRLPYLACPQQMAVGNNHVYWTELGGHLGRATLQGTGASITWLNTRNDNGPFNVAADGANVFWDWGGGAGSPMYVGTARVNGTGVRTKFLVGQGAFLDTAPGAS
jgi:hypothetical protein